MGRELHEVDPVSDNAVPHDGLAALKGPMIGMIMCVVSRSPECHTVNSGIRMANSALFG